MILMIRIIHYKHVLIVLDVWKLSAHEGGINCRGQVVPAESCTGTVSGAEDGGMRWRNQWAKRAGSSQENQKWINYQDVSFFCLDPPIWMWRLINDQIPKATMPRGNDWAFAHQSASKLRKFSKNSNGFWGLRALALEVQWSTYFSQWDFEGV